MLRRTCVQVIKDEDNERDRGEPHETATPSDVCPLFREYERQISVAVPTLRSEHVPIDVDDDTTRSCRRIKTPTKRQKCPKDPFVCADRPALKKQEVMGNVKREVVKHEAKREVNPGDDLECAKQKANRGFDFASQANRIIKSEEDSQMVPQQDNRFASVQGRVREHSEVHAFDIERLDRLDTVGRIPIPSYITANPIGQESIKVVNLGFQQPIRTLLNVLQVEEDEVQAWSEIIQRTCHCLQMKLISDRLECTLFISWSPGGEHEMYGNEHKNVRLYTIIVYKHDHLRSYYLLSVKSCGLYTYNLAKIPYSAQFQPPGHGFVHQSDGVCQGPGLSDPTHDVDTIETSQIILHGNL